MPLLQNFPIMDTAYLGEARHIVGNRFCSHKLETINSGNTFRARHNLVEGRMMSLNYLSYGEKVLIEPGELEHFYQILIPMRGRAEVRNGGQNFSASAQNGAILNPDRHTRMIWTSDCEQLLINIPCEHLHCFAEHYLGRQLDQPIVFHPQIDFGINGMKSLRNAAIVFARAADEGHLFGMSNSLSQSMHEENFIATLLQFQKSNVQGLGALLEGVVAPGHVKRACDFVLENAAKSISLKDIASAAEVPIRTLQHQFQYCIGMSPMELLRQERLRRIYYELNSGHAHEGLAIVAARWGFTHFGRFSQTYKAQYGELPSMTRSLARQSRYVM
ncbi:MAG: AraC family transcriptional regulator [Cohaesibacteraceae bacterium]|nr:AraC family transcriptional regulator [Cohaesibacteraceae bacterium]